MDFQDLAKKRRSVRAFSAAPLPESALEAILEAVRLAPSAGNVQAFKVKIIREKALLEGLAGAAFGQGFLAKSPVALAFLADTEASGLRYGQRGRDLYAVQDATIACLFAHLAAADLGLGSVWVGAFSPAAVSEILGTPAHLVPVAILPIGIPDEDPPGTPRKPMASLLI